jgi:dihydropteroate synthase
MRKNRDEVTYFQRNKTVLIDQKIFTFDETKVMGIINATPDSFYSGSRVENNVDLLKKVEGMLQFGADIIDLGAYSSRPGADDVPESIEKERVLSSTRAIKKEFPSAILSIDTFRSNVAQSALDEGANIINDISAGELDPKMPELVAKYSVPYIIMHMKGNPQTMQSLTEYENLHLEIINFFSKKVESFKKLGIHDIIIDPGIGFSKTVEQNFELIKNIGLYKELKHPVLFGISRKSFIHKKLNVSVENSLNGTTALHSFLAWQNCDILRTHDVAETRQVVELLRNLR